MCEIILGNTFGNEELDSLALLVGHHPDVLNAAPAPAGEKLPVDLIIAAYRSGANNARIIAEAERQRHPAPVPVSERPWESNGWCDEERRCWFCNAYSMGLWRYDIPPDPEQDWGRLGTLTHSLPHWAIPRPTPLPAKEVKK